MRVSSKKVPVSVWNLMSLAQRWDVLVQDESGPFSDERDLHGAFARLLGGLAIPFQHDRMDKATTGTVGWPDFTILLPNGRTWLVEVKHPAAREPMNDLSEGQRYMRKAASSMGHDHSVLNKWDDLVRELNTRLF